MVQPIFFLVGAPKAGTTSLYHSLRQHPDIYMSPIKEPCHFSIEVRPENFTLEQRPRVSRVERETLNYLRGSMDRPRSGGIVRDWEDYLKLFSAARGEHAIGEASVGYMVSPYAAAGIARRLPHAKIHMVLRSPTDRAFSHYLHCVSDGMIHCSFRDYVRASLRSREEGLGMYRPFLEMGYYSSQIQRFLERFPRNQIGVWIYEEALEQPDEFLRQVFRFLDVDDRFEPDRTKWHHEPRIPRLRTASKPLRWARMTRFCREILPPSWRAAIRDIVYSPKQEITMTAADRKMMLDFYHGDICKLQELLGRDLGFWLVEGSEQMQRTGALR